MEYILICVLSLFIGWLTFPLLVFMRARKDPFWDDSNMTNIYRLIGHIATHPSDFAVMYYLPDNVLDETINRTGGDWPRKPFWYLGRDEFRGVVKTRPDDEQQAG